MPRGKAKPKLMEKPDKSKVELKMRHEDKRKIETVMKDLFDNPPEKENIVVNETNIELPVIEQNTIKNVKSVSNIKCDTFGMIKNGTVYQVDISHPVISGYVDSKLLVVTNEAAKIDWKEFLSLSKRKMIKYFEKQRRIYRANAEKNGNRLEVQALKDVVENKINNLINELEGRYA